MKILLLNLVLFLFGLVTCEYDDYFSSLVRLEELSGRESEFVKKLEAIAVDIKDDYVKR